MGAPPSLPLLTRAGRPLTVEVSAVNEKGDTVAVSIAAEHDLTLSVDQREVVTLMTLGAWPEALAIGYLRNQRLVERVDQIASVQVDWDARTVAVTTRSGLGEAVERIRPRIAATACGQGTMFRDPMRDLQRIEAPPQARLDQARLFALMDRVRELQTIHRQAGAVHDCALARNGNDGIEVLMFVEDVSRHNAVDIVAGRMWLEALDPGDTVLITTGRLTSEMMIKTAQMGIPFVISRNGVTQKGWEIARHSGITAIGRAQGRHYLVYTGSERISR